MKNSSSRFLFLGLALLMVATRSHHFAGMTHLPDASWAVFFLAGFYLRPGWAFAALLGLAVVSDYLAIAGFGVDDFCLSAAYAFLLPAYGALSYAGRRFAGFYRFQWSTVPRLAGFALAGAAAAELLSSGGFYFFSGRFADPAWSEFVTRLGWYFPGNLESLALYLGAAAVAHGLLNLAGAAAGRSSAAY